MNGYHHRKLLYLTFIPAAFIILYLQFENIIKFNLLFTAYFILWWAIGTWIWTPDKDLELPFFKHHGITHSFPLWFSVGVFGYFLYWLVFCGVSCYPIDSYRL